MRGLAVGLVLLTGGLTAEPVRIGLFAPTAGDAAIETRAAEQGLRLALSEANESGGRRFELIVVSADLPWAGAAGRLARLAYDEGVKAVVGGLDGRSAHVAEQVAARAKGDLLFVTPWASDPTLIRIPWFARTIPDDRIQAVELIREIYIRRGFRRVAVVQQEGDYDAERAAAPFIAHAPVPPEVVKYRPGDLESRVLDALTRARCEALVLFGEPGPAGRLVARMRSDGLRVAVFASLRLASPLFERTVGTGAAVNVLRPSTPGAAAFRVRYRAAYGAEPWPLSFYAYEAGKMVVRAAESHGRKVLPGQDALGDAVSVAHLVEARERP